MTWKNWFSIIILITAVVISAAVLLRAENIYEKEVEIEKSAVKFAREVVKGGYGIVTTDELEEWMDDGKDMLIVDAMPSNHYNKKHIPGAKQFLFPIPEMKTWDTLETDEKTKDDYASLLGRIKDRPIVLYCGFVKCTRSHNAAIWAKKLGYTNVYRYPGGIYAWEGADNKLEAAK